MRTIDTPWTNMSNPSGEGINTLRVKQAHPIPWYWIKACGGLYGVAVQLPESEQADSSAIQGTSKINIVRVNGANGEHYLGVVINASELATVFHQLCLDLMSACSFSTNAEEIITILKRRVLAWQRLFEKGNRKLSPEKCLGLATELEFLRSCWLQGIASNDLAGWVGPSGAPQDFRDDVQGLSIEVKSHAFHSNLVKISSKQQLDSENRLFMVAYPGCLSSDNAKGVTLNECIDKTRKAIPPEQHAFFDEQLLSIGYVYDSFYDDMYFIIGEAEVYRVEGSFPRLTVDTLPFAIGKVKYELDLDMATEWRCSFSDIH